jgi:hypothetical protein
MLMGIGTRSDVTMSFSFPSLFWKYLTRVTPDLKDLKKINFLYVQFLGKLEECQGTRREEGKDGTRKEEGGKKEGRRRVQGLTKDRARLCRKFSGAFLDFQRGRHGG